MRYNHLHRDGHADDDDEEEKIDDSVHMAVPRAPTLLTVHPSTPRSPYTYEETPNHPSDEPGGGFDDHDESDDTAAAAIADSDDPFDALSTFPSTLKHATAQSSASRSCGGCVRGVLGVENMRLAYQSIGVIFGDIGTSPLYALTAIFSPSSDDPALTLDATTTADVLGVMSLLFWALTMVVTVKYICIVLLADDRGDGGSFALLNLLRRHHPHSQSNPPTPRAAFESREDSDGHREPHAVAATSRRWLLSDPLRALTLLSFFGACLLIGDGVITPAISVLSAVEGIAVANSSLSELVVPLSLLVLGLLFLAERFGTAGISQLFSPVMLLWFLSLFALGLYNLATAPTALTLSILGSLSPQYAAMFFYRHGVQSISHMAAVVLCVTGVEAMFADMGHFSRRSIRTSWLMLVYPSLVVQYLGQGVRLLANPAIAGQVFYGAIPFQNGALFWFMVLLSTCATVIASQALISGAFSITRTAIRMHFAPALPIVHTSSATEGHIYIPQVNWLLCTCTCACVIAFRTSTNLANAYGVAVCCDMLLTSVFLCCVMRSVWHRSRVLVVGYVVVFMTIDAVFMLGNLAKIAAGGWLPLSFALLLSGMLFVWECGQRRLAQEQSKQPRTAHQWKDIGAMAAVTYHVDSHDRAATQNAAWAVFFAEPGVQDLPEFSEDGVHADESGLSKAPAMPISAWQLFKHMRIIPSRALFVAVSTDGAVAYVEQEGRIRWREYGSSKPLPDVEVRCLELRYGFMQDESAMIAEDIASALLERASDTDSPHPPPTTHFFIGGYEMVCDLSAQHSRWTPTSRGLLSKLRWRTRILVDWARTLPRYWLMIGFNMLSRGTCHGDTYQLPTHVVVKLVSKIDFAFDHGVPPRHLPATKLDEDEQAEAEGEAEAGPYETD